MRTSFTLPSRVIHLFLYDIKSFFFYGSHYSLKTGTFKNDCDLGTGEGGLDPLDVETQRLVLEAGPGGWVALRRKQYGARSQLWRMTGDGQLQHEGTLKEMFLLILYLKMIFYE